LKKLKANPKSSLLQSDLAWLDKMPPMAAKDLYHEHVKHALISDGWTITHDPLRLEWGEKYTLVDLGAERLLAAHHSL
jgi:hypothetical protein